MITNTNNAPPINEMRIKFHVFYLQALSIVDYILFSYTYVCKNQDDDNILRLLLKKCLFSICFYNLENVYYMIGTLKTS